MFEARRYRWVIVSTGAATILAAGVLLGYALRPDSGAHVLARTADEWAALGTCATFVVATVAAVIAFTQASEARRLRIDQAQPYVVAYMEQNPNASIVVELVIRNFGTTAARNIRIESAPTIRRSGDVGQAQDVWLPNDIPVLAPQQEWRTYWDSGETRGQNPRLASENRHVVTVTYDGVEHTPRQRTDSVLDWEAYVGRVYMQTKTMHHAAGSLDRLATTLGKWSESAQGGLAVYTRDGHARDASLAATWKARKEKIRRRDEASPPESPEEWLG